MLSKCLTFRVNFQNAVSHPLRSLEEMHDGRHGWTEQVFVEDGPGPGLTGVCNEE